MLPVTSEASSEHLVVCSDLNDTIGQRGYTLGQVGLYWLATRQMAADGRLLRKKEHRDPPFLQIFLRQEEEIFG